MAACCATTSFRKKRRPLPATFTLTSWVLCLCTLFGNLWQSECWIPPHPKSRANWESVHDMRRRLNATFDYTPSLIHHEACRYFSEEECRDFDTSMNEYAHMQRQLQSWIRANPYIGSFKVLILLMRFTDHQDRDLLDKSVIEDMWNNEITKWFQANALGKYEIEPVVIDWMDTDDTEEHYSFGQSGQVAGFGDSAAPLLDKLDQDPSWDWSDFDRDGDGKLDSVILLHSGYGAETFENDCYGRSYLNRIWAHAFTNTGGIWKSSREEPMKMVGYVVASTRSGSCDSNPPTMGLTVHEYIHTFGLPDLYDLGASQGTSTVTRAGVGSFDIMANPYGPGNDGVVCGHLNAWSKNELDWNDIKEIKNDGLYTLEAAATTEQAYRITLKSGVYPEYLLIENRQRLAYDRNLWDSGLAIYHVDDLADLQSARGYPGQDGWPENGNHYQIAVLPKDGLYELEKGIDDGDAGDLWKTGDILGPGKGSTVFPNTDAYQGGDIQETGIEIEVISEDGTDITFRIGGLGDNNGDQDVTWEPSDYVIPWDVTAEIIGTGGSGNSGGPNDGSGFVVPAGYWSLSRPPVPKREQPPPAEDGFGGIAIWSIDYSSARQQQQQHHVGIYILSMLIGAVFWLVF